MWLDKLKVAIVEKDANAIDKLLDSTPKFTDVKEAESAMYLFQEVADLMHKLKAETSATMIQLKKNIDFLNSSHTFSSNKIDIKS